MSASACAPTAASNFCELCHPAPRMAAGQCDSRLQPPGLRNIRQGMRLSSAAAPCAAGGLHAGAEAGYRALRLSGLSWEHLSRAAALRVAVGLQRGVEGAAVLALIVAFPHGRQRVRVVTQRVRAGVGRREGVVVLAGGVTDGERRRQALARVPRPVPVARQLPRAVLALPPRQRRQPASLPAATDSPSEPQLDLADHPPHKPCHRPYQQSIVEYTMGNMLRKLRGLADLQACRAGGETYLWTCSAPRGDSPTRPLSWPSPDACRATYACSETNRIQTPSLPCPLFIPCWKNALPLDRLSGLFLALPARRVSSSNHTRQQVQQLACR